MPNSPSNISCDILRGSIIRSLNMRIIKTFQWFFAMKHLPVKLIFLSVYQLCKPNMTLYCLKFFKNMHRITNEKPWCTDKIVTIKVCVSEPIFVIIAWALVVSMSYN
ncbi:hypothetical protein RIR_jg17854.t1 [Rhizophagus irregularis DAOM 181602=DAOM 197198]|nr:hypothetical protein RIR_jg17854.t1 [Rhizophagus irregularis DAOM 181602=DAOM 197198]